MMTLEEAITIIERLAHTEAKWPGTEDTLEALDMAVSALRPVSRERVEGIRGEWMFPIFADQEDANDTRCQCSECGSIETPLARHRFCPSCGAPMTDEAVDIRLKELEALKDGSTTD